MNARITVNIEGLPDGRQPSSDAVSAILEQVIRDVAQQMPAGATIQIVGRLGGSGAAGPDSSSSGPSATEGAMQSDDAASEESFALGLNADDEDDEDDEDEDELMIPDDDGIMASGYDSDASHPIAILNSGHDGLAARDLAMPSNPFASDTGRSRQNSDDSGGTETSGAEGL